MAYTDEELRHALDYGGPGIGGSVTSSYASELINDLLHERAKNRRLQEEIDRLNGLLRDVATNNEGVSFS